MKNILIGFALILTLIPKAWSEDKKTWQNESEAAVVSSSGNTKSETYSGKHKTIYTIETSTLTAQGSYLQGKSSQKNATSGLTTTIESKNWTAGLRYDFNFMENVGAFLGQSAESDENSGYTQRDNTDIGAKYLPFKDDQKSLQSELGYRYTKTNGAGTVTYVNYLRLYLEFNYLWSKDITFKIWAEHLPNLKDSDKYLTNGEVSASVVLSTLLSLKTSYNVKYHNYQTSVDDQRLDSTFLTSLVAKF